MSAELHCTAELLSRKGVDYRVIGSRAVELYGLIHPRQYDIDLVVPRDSLRSMPEVRRDLRDEFPRATLGTMPSRTIDFMPDGQSRLTYRELSVPLDFTTLSKNEIDGVQTLEPHTLLETYGTIGGCYRSKDNLDREFLSLLSVDDPDPAFREFREARERLYPEYKLAKFAANSLLRVIPSRLKLYSQNAIESRLEASCE